MDIFPSIVILIIFSLIKENQPQLLIYVKNQGEDVIKESISANVSDDTVTLEFLRPDGVFITQIIDINNEAQLLKAVIPPEIEFGQNKIQVLCFLSHSDKTEFIASDAMVKLRQKNPGTIRVAEDDKGHESLVMAGWLGLSTARKITPIATKHCSESHAQIFASENSLIKWAARRGLDPKSFLNEVSPFPTTTQEEINSISKEYGHKSCSHTAEINSECTCQFSVCIIWYPCGLKYCKGKNQSNSALQNLSYRCGIKTCKKCSSYMYFVNKKLHCAWYQ